MLNKILTSIILIPILAAAWLGYRYYSNPSSIVPWPYEFKKSNTVWTTDAPILLAGDRMMKRLNQYQTELSLSISEGLEKPIKIESFGAEKENIHRTLFKLQNLEKWPPVVIYQGGSEEGNEDIYLPSEIMNIKKNFLLFQNEAVQTVMTVYPATSRLVYNPFKRLTLTETITPHKEELEGDEKYMSRMEMIYLLYEEALKEMVQLSKLQKSKLILLTTPINLDIRPKKVCSLSESEEINLALSRIRESIKSEDYKRAYQLSSSLSQSAIANAEVFYVFGQVAMRLGFAQEAQDALLKAASFECSLWRSNEVFNSIIKKVAREEKVTLFDFAQFIYDQWPEGKPFFDELYPQNLYYEKAMSLLGYQVKKILKI